MGVYNGKEMEINMGLGVNMLEEVVQYKTTYIIVSYEIFTG